MKLPSFWARTFISFNLAFVLATPKGFGQETVVPPSEAEKKAEEPSSTPPPPVESNAALTQAVNEQLNPVNASQSILEAQKKIQSERKKFTDLRKKRAGVAPTEEKLGNENKVALESHHGFISDLLNQSRYRTPALIVTGTETAGVIAYWLVSRKLKQYWIPRFEATQKLSEGMKEATEALRKAEDDFANAIVRNWDSLDDVKRTELHSALESSFRERVMGDLSRNAAGTSKATEAIATTGKMTAAEAEAIKKAESIEIAFYALRNATRRWVHEIKDLIPKVEESILSTLAQEGAERAAQAPNLRAMLSKDLKALAELEATLNRPGTLSVLLQGRQIGEKLLPKLSPLSQFFSASKDAELAAKGQRIQKAVEEFNEAQNSLRKTVTENWDSLRFEERSLLRPGLSPEFVANELLELQKEASASRASTTAASGAGAASAISEAQDALILKAEALYKVVKADVPDSTALGKLALSDNMAQASARASQVISSELKSLKTMAAEMQTVAAIEKEHGVMRTAIAGAEAEIQSLQTVAEVRSGLAAAKQGWVRRWTSKGFKGAIGPAVFMGIPLIVYAQMRSNALYAESNATFAQTSQLLARKDEIPPTLNLAAIRLQYGAFYHSWMQHVQLGKAGMAFPLAELGVNEDLNGDLIHVFLPLLSQATLELELELDKLNAGIPEHIAALSYDERLYRKLWTLLFVHARAQESHSRLKMMRWSNEPKEDSQGKIPGNVETDSGKELADDIDDLIAELAHTVSVAPQNGFSNAEKSDKTGEGESAAGENPELDALQQMIQDAEAAEAGGGEIGGAPQSPATPATPETDSNPLLKGDLPPPAGEVMDLEGIIDTIPPAEGAQPSPALPSGDDEMLLPIVDPNAPPATPPVAGPTGPQPAPEAKP
jgi:hypothetical protein